MSDAQKQEQTRKLALYGIVLVDLLGFPCVLGGLGWYFSQGAAGPMQILAPAGGGLLGLILAFVHIVYVSRREL